MNKRKKNSTPADTHAGPRPTPPPPLKNSKFCPPNSQIREMQIKKDNSLNEEINE